MNIRAYIQSILKENLAVNDDNVSRRRSIKVTYEDGDTVSTPINGTKQEILDYYVGKCFNMGSGENDKMVKAVSVDFLNESIVQEEENKGVGELWRVLGIKDSRDLPRSPRMKEILTICKANSMNGKLHYWFDHFQGTLNVVCDGTRVVIGVEDGDIAPYAAGTTYPLN